MTTIESNKIVNASLANNFLSMGRHYLGNRMALLSLAVVTIAGGAALNWSWLVAIGVAPILLSALPCLVMCGLGLCMHKKVGGSGQQQVADGPAPPPGANCCHGTEIPTQNKSRGS